KEDCLRVIAETVPPKTVEINRRAFEAGYALES
ncbi:MAG TPA: indolepyruvate oxidoreductase subunit beta, partial [Treponema sp.]|nr:indolepyruvate oxidoreductase subunit beta [Treponema sp.]